MAAILRVKRRCDEDPHDALLISCKRKKHETEPEDNAQSYTTLLKFAGTIKTQEEDIAQHIPKTSKKPIAKTSVKRIANVLQKVRAASKQTSQENRFKVVNCFRALNPADTIGDNLQPVEADKAEAKEGSKLITVVDIEKNVPDESKDQTSSSEGTNPPTDGEKAYVYDLYYTEEIDLDDMLLDTQLSVQPMETELVYDEDGEEEDATPCADDDSDSNDENNWRNEYPDSENSITEEDMVLAMQMDDMNLGNELSSDDGEEEYIYSKKSDPRDIGLYGSSYARYKRRVIEELEDSDDSNAS